MRAFSYAWLLPVTPFDRPYPKAPALRKLHGSGSMIYRTGVIADRSFTFRE